MSEEFKLETTFTDQGRNYLRLTAIVLAAAGLLLIVLSITTNLAAWVLPMDENYLLALVPQAPDGTEPLALQTLEHETVNNTLTVTGRVLNRTEFALSGVQAFIQIQDRYGLNIATAMVPLEPAEVPPQETGTFQISVTPETPLAGYSLKFQMAEGPFIPHKDERAANFNLAPEAEQ